LKPQDWLGIWRLWFGGSDEGFSVGRRAHGRRSRGLGGDAQLYEASERGDVEVLRVLLARPDVDVNHADEVRAREGQRGREMEGQ
jgi:hypothetical protein